MPYLQLDSPVRQSDYTCDEYAQRFNLAPSTVRTKVSRGEVPSYKVGGARRIPAEYVASITAEVKRVVDAASTPAPARVRKRQRRNLVHRGAA